MGVGIGIDLGTTYSAVACVNPSTGKAEILKNRYGESLTPSVLAFLENGTVLHGSDAKELQESGNANTVSFFKKNMGRADFCIEFFGKRYTATDLSAILLKRLVEDAALALGDTIDGAVITAPAYFNHPEREATIQAGEKAGINVLCIISEPTAAAFAYGINQKGVSKKVLIYDLGGGTFDVTIAQIDDEAITITGTGGDHDLGGANWDSCIFEYLANSFNDEFDIDLRDDPDERARLIVMAENVKKQLSARSSTQAVIHYRGMTGTYTLTEEKFRDLSDYYMGITRDLCESVLSEADWGWSDIDGVILIGGSTRMKMVRDYVSQMCGAPSLGGINVDEAVALGAAIRANIDDAGRVTMRLGGGAVPVMSLAGAKALKDVVAHDLGMIAVNEDATCYINSILIERNSPIPHQVTQPYRFRTGKENQELEVYMLQGSAEYPLNCLILGRYVFSGIRAQKSGLAIIDVTYSYTANGLVEVSAVQTETGARLPMRIDPVPDDMSWVNEAPPKPVLPVEVAIAVDLSGSMYTDVGSSTAIELAREAASDFVDKLPQGTRVSVIGFSDRCRILIQKSDNNAEIKAAIRRLAVGDTGGGNDAHPFLEAYNLLGQGDAQRYVVVLTDGQWYCIENAIRSAHMCHRAGIDVIALGFGSADYAFLKEIASKDDLAEMTEVTNLAGSFGKIAQVISARPALKG